MPRVLVTGANRGIGLEFVRQYAADGWQVIACCRRPDEAIKRRRRGLECIDRPGGPDPLADEERVRTDVRTNVEGRHPRADDIAERSVLIGVP